MLAHSLGVVPVELAPQRRERDDAVERARVDDDVAEARRHLLGDGRLSGSGGAIDRDDQALHLITSRSAPSARNVPTKRG